MILLVDDEPWFVSPLRDALESAGFATSLAMSADQCMESIGGQERIDAVILDVMLPPGKLDLEEVDHGINTGLILLRMIREKRPRLPVIIFSVRGDIMVPDSPDAPTLFISKSAVTPTELVEAVKQLCEGELRSRG